MARRLRLRWIVDVMSVTDGTEIRALVNDAKLDRRFEARGPLLNRMLAGRVRRVLNVGGVPFPAVAPRQDDARGSHQAELRSRLDALAAASQFDAQTLDELAKAVRGTADAMPLAHAAQQAIGRLFVADYRATAASWNAARYLEQAVRSANPLAPLWWRITGKLDTRRQVLSDMVFGDPAGVHATAIAIHNLVRSFEMMRTLLAQPGNAQGTSAEGIVAIVLAAPPKILRQATAAGAVLAGDLGDDTLVVLELRQAQRRQSNPDLTFLAGTWAQCPAATWVPALLRAVWHRAVLLPKPRLAPDLRATKLSWTRAQAERRQLAYRSVLGAALVLEFVFGAVAVLKPALLSAMIGIAAAAAISFVRPWGALLIVAAILYSRGWLHPRQARWPNFVGIAGRLALALLYLTLGGGFIWLALFEGLFGVLLAWTYSRLLVAELLTRP